MEPDLKLWNESDNKLTGQKTIHFCFSGKWWEILAGVVEEEDGYVGKELWCIRLNMMLKPSNQPTSHIMFTYWIAQPIVELGHFKCLWLEATSLTKPSSMTQGRSRMFFQLTESNWVQLISCTMHHHSVTEVPNVELSFRIQCIQ